MFDPIHGPRRIAKDVLEALVNDLKLQPGQFVYEDPVHIAFKFRGLAAEDIWAGLEYAKQQEWLMFDSVRRVYTLTKAGFAMI